MKSILSSSSIEIEIKKSKFLGFAYPINEQTNISSLLASLKEQHKNATHVCYAYILKNGVAKCGDNGEPAGTAGLPILSVLKKNNLENVLLVVVRYFGGIKLGAGGLIRAYSLTAGQVLKNAEICELKPCYTYELTCLLSEIKNVEQLLKKQNVKVISKMFSENAIFTIALEHEMDMNNLPYACKLIKIENK